MYVRIYVYGALDASSTKFDSRSLVFDKVTKREARILGSLLKNPSLKMLYGQDRIRLKLGKFIFACLAFFCTRSPFSVWSPTGWLVLSWPPRCFLRIDTLSCVVYFVPLLVILCNFWSSKAVARNTTSKQAGFSKRTFRCPCNCFLIIFLHTNLTCITKVFDFCVTSEVNQRGDP